MVQEIAALGFSIKELPILFPGKLKVPIDISAHEPQIKDALSGVVCR
jgi:hypothetical protein